MQKQENKPLLKKVLLIFNIVMISVFFGLGFFILANREPFTAPLKYRVIQAVLLFAYGAFRIYRTVKVYRSEQ